MAEIATPHRTRPVEVLITEPLTVANRGEIARWLEDRGIAVGVPPDGGVIVTTRYGDEHFAGLGERIVVDGRKVDVVDQAHYKLWYEPITERTGP